MPSASGVTPGELRERITGWAVDVGHLVSPLFLLRGAATARALDEGRQLTRILAKSRETAQDRGNLSRKGKGRQKDQAPNDQ